MQRQHPAKLVAHEAAMSIQCSQTGPEKAVEVASLIGANFLDDISLKDTATEDHADAPDSFLVALKRRACDALRAMGPGAVSLSDHEQRYFEEVISEILIYDRNTGRRGLADPNRVIAIAKGRVLARERARHLRARPSGDEAARPLPLTSGNTSHVADMLSGPSGVDNLLDRVFDRVCDWLESWRTGVGSDLDGGGGTKTCHSDSGEDFVAPRVPTKESFGDAAGVYPVFLLP